MSNDAPQPGEPGYDEYIAARYRAQKDGQAEVPLTDSGQAASSYRHIVDDRGNVKMSIREGSTLGPANQSEHYSAEMADPAQVRQVEAEAERIRAELAEVSHIDPRTGESVPRYTGEHRRTREVRLDHLERLEIPGVRALQAKAAAWREHNVPTTLQTLSEERARRDRLSIRAQEIADEREAQAQADAIAAERRSRG
jgi:hypothetical protein